MIKRWTAMFMMLVLLLVLAACGGEEASSSLAQTSSRPPASRSVSLPAPESSVPAAQPGVNALTGLPIADEMVAGQRPVAVMISNTLRAFPQRGVAHADLLVEMPLEDGGTDLIAVYANYNTVPQVGPVTELQDPFLQMMMPLQAIPVHTGTNSYAHNLLTATGYKSLDGVYLGQSAFWYDEARALPRLTGHLHEYNWFTDAALLMAGMTAVDMPVAAEVPSLFNFLAGPLPEGDTALTVQAVFTDTSYSEFEYVAEEDVYYKKLMDGRHMDENGAQHAFTNLLLLECLVGQKADSQYLEYDFSGGVGWLFSAGSVTSLKWVKGNPNAPLKLYDEGNKELSVPPGKSYIGMVPAGRENAVNWAGAAPPQATDSSLPPEG